MGANSDRTLKARLIVYSHLLYYRVSDAISSIVEALKCTLWVLSNRKYIMYSYRESKEHQAIVKRSMSSLRKQAGNKRNNVIKFSTKLSPDHVYTLTADEMVKMFDRFDKEGTQEKK